MKTEYTVVIVIVCRQRHLPAIKTSSIQTEERKGIRDDVFTFPLRAYLYAVGFFFPQEWK